MSASKTTSAGIPEVNPQQGLEDNKATLEDKIKRLEAIKTENRGHDYPAALARAKRQLTEVNSALRKESK